MSVFLINLDSFKTVIQYNIIPDIYFVASDYLISDQTVEVDFSNKRVVFPM